MTDKIRVLIADDHAIVREGLRTLIGIEPGMEVVGEAGDGSQAVALARSLRPDVILLDMVMPRRDGLETIHEIMAENQGLTSWCSPAFPTMTRFSRRSRREPWATCSRTPLPEAARRDPRRAPGRADDVSRHRQQMDARAAARV